MLGPGLLEQLGALAVEEDDRAQVDVELHIDEFGQVLAGRGADAHAGVVDQHVEPAEALAVAADDLADRVLVGQVSGH